MKNIILIISIIFILGCTNNDNKSGRYTQEQIENLQLDSTIILTVRDDSVTNINLDPYLNDRSFDFDTLIKEVRLIPLETNEESLLDRIKKIIITDSNIYVYDDLKGGSIVIFNKEGAFISRLPNGRGPGEISRLYDIDFDDRNDELIAYQHSYLKFYTPSGEFIRQQRLPIGVYNFSTTPSGYVFKTLSNQGNNHLRNLDDFRLLITNKSLSLESVGLPTPSINVKLESPFYLQSSNDDVYITQRFTDTIYYYSNKSNQIKAKYKLNYKGYKMPDRFLEGSNDEFKDAVSNNDYYFYLGEYLDVNTHHVFYLHNWYKSEKPVFYRDKSSGSIRGGKSALFNINKIPPIAYPRWTYKEYFVSIYYFEKSNMFVENSKIISDDDKDKVKHKTKNDNPVIVLFKLKKY